MKMSNLVVRNTNGRVFKAVIIKNGDRYGRDNVLVNKGEPLVEFWDLTSGQFVSRYYIYTIMENYVPNTGLNLDGGVPEWTIDGDAMNLVVSFLIGENDEND